MSKSLRQLVVPGWVLDEDGVTVWNCGLTEATGLLSLAVLVDRAPALTLRDGEWLRSHDFRGRLTATLRDDDGQVFADLDQVSISGMTPIFALLCGAVTIPSGRYVLRLRFREFVGISAVWEQEFVVE